MGDNYAGMRLFRVSFLILFLELACIRWFGSTVVFLTFFTNVVLLATFLGMSVGCLAARDRRPLVTTVIPLLLLSVVLALGVWYVYTYVGQIAVLLLVALAAHVPGLQTIWSPYYKISYQPIGGLISTNNIGHQQMIGVAKTGPGYLLPHILNKESGAAPFDEVLIVGAGSGNDVAAALQSGVGHVDAVEIDPAIF